MRKCGYAGQSDDAKRRKQGDGPKQERIIDRAQNYKKRLLPFSFNIQNCFLRNSIKNKSGYAIDANIAGKG